MSIKILTSNTIEYKPLADITFPTKAAYAELWGFDLEQKIHTPKNLPWERVKFWREALDSCKVLLFTGADVMITNKYIPIGNLMADIDKDFYFAVDHNGLQSDSWIMRSNTTTRHFLDEVLLLEGNCANEQDAMQIILSRQKDYGALRRSVDGNGTMSRDQFYSLEMNNTPVRCKILNRREINAMPYSHYGGTGNEPYSWQGGDFVLHMPGKSLEYRVEHMPAYLPEQ